MSDLRCSLILTASHAALTRSEPDAVRVECGCGRYLRTAPTTDEAVAEWHAHAVRRSFLDHGIPAEPAVSVGITARTPIGTRIRSVWHGVPDQGVIVGASSAVVLYLSDRDGLTYGIAGWELDAVEVLAAL